MPFFYNQNLDADISLSAFGVVLLSEFEFQLGKLWWYLMQTFIKQII